MIRFATVEDIPRIFYLLYELGEMSPNYWDTTRCEEHSRRYLEYIIQNPYSIVLVEDEVKGIILGNVAPRWNTPDLIGHEEMFYVQEASRGSRIAVALLRRWEKVCTALGAIALHVGTTTAIDTEKTLRFYGRMGYEPYGQSLMKRI